MSISGNRKRRSHLSRRAFLGLGGMSAAALLLGTGALTSNRALAQANFLDDPFKLGVASGDPLPDGVVLWTRLAPDPFAEDGSSGMPQEPFGVRYEVAGDESFRRIVKRGAVEAIPELGHSVHAEVSGLLPGREYFYRFKAGPEISPVGRTKTAPAPNAPLDALTFAFASCQENSNQRKYYTAYANMAEEDLDLVIHLGDYIYDNPISQDATPPDHVKGEPETLEEFRWRHALYRVDADLQRTHARFPWIVTWDDHEVAGNWADEYSKEYPDRGRFLAIRQAAFRAYYEHMPLRRASIPSGPDMQLYRKITFGNMAEFNVMDTRQYRDRQTTCQGEEMVDGYCASATDPNRTILGDEQERWLLSGLAASTARWNVLAQQIVFAQNYNSGGTENPNYVGGGDQWDGYKADRDTILEFIQARRPSNPIVLTGDQHQNRVYDLKADFSDPDSETLGSEFVGTSISSGGDNPSYTTRYDDPNDPHQRFQNNNRGYVRCKLTPELWLSDFRIVLTVKAPTSPISTLETFVVENGRPGTQRA